MLNTVYQLVAPRKFEVTYENIGLQDDDIIVRPTHLSICNADQRYYCLLYTSPSPRDTR